jgi:predicted esterase
MIQLFTIALLTIPQIITAGGQVGLHPPRRVPGKCNFIGASHAMAFTPGAPVENFLVTTADPDPRRFIVYVPSSYQATQGPYPVVFMLHGTGQTAGSPYSRLTWDEAAEALDFIAVFPEALPYLLLDGTTRTKWATAHVANDLVDPLELPLADDVLFLRELFNTLGTHLAIDCDRIYASGFSNGGAFVKAEIRTQLADIFAATSSAGGIGVRVNYPGEFYPANGIDFRPHYEIVGNKDENKEDACIAAGDLAPGNDLPMAAADIMAMPCLWDTIHAMASEVGMDASVFSSVEQIYTTEILWSTNAFPASVPREYRFRVLRNLTHEYPSGANYPTDYVPILYDWMLQYTR